MSDLKTSYGYNENDFVEKDRTLHELTVTITLAEYRDLIATKECLLKTRDDLQAEVDKLTEQNKSLSQAIIASNGGKLFKNIGKAIGDAFALNEEEAEEETE